jgi:probable non-F420 flavinoid oxidoreductase
VTTLSYHASHEQFAPSALLRFVRRAEHAGFDAAFSSDHLQPWTPEQGHSGHSWSWLGAALGSTSRLTFGTITVPCGWRYHPVVLAQAIATLGEMYPGRIPWVAVGSGEAVNERATGAAWPAKAERNERLREGAAIMTALLAGETVTHRGRIGAADARLWSLPPRPTRIVGAAVSARTARWLGGWADGLLTTSGTLAGVRENVTAFRDGGGDSKPVHLKTQVCWAATEEEALRQAHEQWRFSALGTQAAADVASPEEFARAARAVRPEDLRRAVFISSDLGRHAQWLNELRALGVDSIDVHNVGAAQEEFIDAFGAKVLPQLR